MAEEIQLPKGTTIPDHIAIIPDGNRRWARAQGLPTLQGHARGFDRAVEVSRAARHLGIHTATLWGFSTENWERSKKEVSYLMKLYEKLVDDYLKEAKKDKVKIVHLGRKDRIPKSLLAKIVKAEEETKNYTRYIINIAIDYGGQDEILRGIQKVVRDGISADKIDRKLFENYLDTASQPYPYVDLIIRTSGEQRISGFLAWQACYAEYYWEDGHFPDFSPEKLKVAILDYSRRRRRFGGNDAIEHFSFDPEVVAKLELAWWRLSKIPEGTRFRDYAMKHLKEQFGLSKTHAKEAARYMIEAALEENNGRNWEKAKGELKKFYKLIKGELKLAFEPSIVASLEVKLRQGLEDKDSIEAAGELEDTARSLYAETYRISLLQAAKLGHLRIMAGVERNLAQMADASGPKPPAQERLRRGAGLWPGGGEEHWVRAQDYLERFYRALKERVA